MNLKFCSILVFGLHLALFLDLGYSQELLDELFQGSEEIQEEY